MVRLAAVLSGSLGKVLAGYEPRPGQLAMAEAIEDAFAQDRSLIVEAGTGTGKTLAYLIPAVLSQKKVIVSTATLTLQEQIWKQDLPLVAELLAPHGITFEAALMKGLSNYVCRRRLDEAAREDPLLADDKLHRLRRWAETSPTGDRADLELAEDAPLWARVSSSPETRIGAPCKHFEACFVTQMKRRAERARLVVVNHHLFCADLALRQTRAAEYGAAVLPPYDAIIFDEAHQLEEVATDFFGLRVSTAKIDAVLRDVRRAFTSAGRSDPKLGSLCEQVELASRSFFGALALRAQSQQSDSGPRSQRFEAGARKLLARDAWSGEALRAMHKLDASLEALARHADSVANDEAIELCAMRAARLRAELAEIVEGSQKTAPADDDFPIDEAPPLQPSVAWIETRDRSTTIGSARVDIGRELRQTIWARVPTVIMTSATLTTAGANNEPSFGYTRARLGAPDETRELWVPSPFDFGRRAGLYVARDLPDPSDARFDDAASDRALELARVVGGGAFVLCTSTRAMQRFYEVLSAELPDVFVQGQAPKHQLLERFRAHGDAVLVATMSFWEGVDVPGAALRLVVIDRIPFAVPSDPVVMARAEAISRAGGNPFAEYTVPSAGILLKQGFGRLIRSTKDAGIVAILDRRLVTKPYGRTLLTSLPPAKRLHTLDDARQFFAAIR